MYCKIKRQQKHTSTTIKSSSNSHRYWLRCWVFVAPLLALVSLARISQILIDMQTTTKPVNLSSLEPDDPRLLSVIRHHFLRLPIEGHQDKEENFSTQQLQGQIGQVPIIDALLREKEEGFFVEAGALDGVYLSNTLFFEKKRKWSGLLVEGSPSHYKNLEARQLGMPQPKDLMERKQPPVPLTGNISNTIRIQCFSLYSLLLAVGHTEVDFFSLDVEGGEFPIIMSIPFDKVTIHLLMIEVAWLNTVFNGTRAQLNVFLDTKGYDLLGNIGQGRQDAIYGRRTSFLGKSALRLLEGKTINNFQSVP